MESEKPTNDSVKNLNYSLYLGCVIPNRYPLIERSSRTLFDALGITVDEMEGASCCPAPGVFRSVDNAMWLTVGARNINIAEQNKNDLLTLCNGCNGTLNEVNHQLQNNDKLKGRINEVLSSVGRTYTGTSKVRHLMDVLYYDIGVDKLKSLVKRKLNLNVAVHYGCHILKPTAIQVFGQNPDDPTFFDEIVEATGATSLNYRKKMMCCGAGGAVRTANKSVSSALTLEKLREVRKAGADCIVVCCPFCQLQYDLGQLEVGNLMDEGEDPFKIPVLYISQLLGLAMGLDPEKLGMIKPTDMKGISPFTSLDPILEKIKDMPLLEEGN